MTLILYRSRACTDGDACAGRMSNPIVTASLILATLLVAAALGLDFMASFFLNS